MKLFLLSSWTCAIDFFALNHGSRYLPRQLAPNTMRLKEFPRKVPIALTNGYKAWRFLQNSIAFLPQAARKAPVH